MYNFSDPDKKCMKKSEVIAWYLDQVQDQIDSEPELLDRKFLIEKIISRLVYHDGVLIELKEEDTNAEDPFIDVHHDYVVE